MGCVSASRVGVIRGAGKGAARTGTFCDVSIMRCRCEVIVRGVGGVDITHN